MLEEIIKIEDCSENIGDYDIPIHKGVIIPKGATIGDVVQTIFPNINFGTLAQDDVIVNKDYSANDEPQVFIPIKIWNAPYESESEG